MKKMKTENEKRGITEKLGKPGNLSLILGIVLGINAFSCPCPTCILGSVGLLVYGIKEKVGAFYTSRKK